MYPNESVEYPPFNNLSIFSPGSIRAIAPYLQCIGLVFESVPSNA